MGWTWLDGGSLLDMVVLGSDEEFRPVVRERNVFMASTPVPDIFGLDPSEFGRAMASRAPNAGQRDEGSLNRDGDAGDAADGEPGGGLASEAADLLPHDGDADALDGLSAGELSEVGDLLAMAMDASLDHADVGTKAYPMRQSTSM